jgi:hypothetical protein
MKNRTPDPYVFKTPKRRLDATPITLCAGGRQVRIAPTLRRDPPPRPPGRAGEFERERREDAVLRPASWTGHRVRRRPGIEAGPASLAVEHHSSAGTCAAVWPSRPSGRLRSRDRNTPRMIVQNRTRRRDARRGAITVALCGHREHQPPCPTAPHHASAERGADPELPRRPKIGCSTPPADVVSVT